MSFNFFKVGKNTEIDHALLYKMARNDDYLKNLYETVAKGVSNWSEIDSNFSISGLDREARSEDNEDPNWTTLQEAAFFIRPREIFSFDYWAFSNVVSTAPAGSLQSSAPQWRAGHRLRLLLDGEEESAGSDDGASSSAAQIVIAQDQGELYYYSYNRQIQSGGIRGRSIAVGYDQDQLDNIAFLVFIFNLQGPPPLKTGPYRARLQVNRLDPSQTLMASGSRKSQLVIKNLGDFKYV